MHRGVATATVAAALLTALPAAAAPAAYDVAFVDAFADACVPGRLSYEGTQTAAEAAGWVKVGREADAELDAMMAISEAGAQDAGLEMSYDYTIFARDVAEAPHFLVVSRTSAIIGERDDPLNPWVMIGCYLYNFNAAAAIDPEVVSALIGTPVAQSQVDMQLSAYVWGPPAKLPRTLDTYMTFIPEVSLYREQTGFSGLVLKFSTSEGEDGA